jgi:hypothetical protein
MRRIAGASSSLRDLCTWERLLKCAAVEFRVRALSSTSNQDRAYSLQVPLNGFVIELEDRPGSVADVTEVLAKRGVNLLVTGFASRGGGVAAFVCETKAALARRSPRQESITGRSQRFRFRWRTGPERLHR